MSTSIIVGGSSGIGRFIAQQHADRGDRVVVTSRDAIRAKQVAAEIGGDATGVGLDLAAPESIEAALADITEVDHLVVTAIDQGVNKLANFDIPHAVAAVTVKLVGYTETIRALRDRFRPGASVVLFGGAAKDRPYPGSTMVTAFNGGIAALINTLAVELAPHRVNAIHPGLVGDSPKWQGIADTHPHLPRTPIERFVTMAEVADAVEFLLRNGGINGHNLSIEGGLLTN
jgi:NAD(P)-dependent dehydrogenase (short-subunit alcohol dehydrogenase family)